MKIAVIGGGNMGGAIASGAIAAGVVGGNDVAVSHARPLLLDNLKRLGTEIVLSQDNRSVVPGADLVIVAVKPWLMAQVLGEIAPILDREHQAVASVAAGISFDTLSAYLGCAESGPVALYRVIPNTAISLGQSMTFLAKQRTSVAQDENMIRLFGALGQVMEVTEEQMTACTALASCGIAYIFRYIDAAVRGGEQMGMSRSEGLPVVMQTVRGALAMLERNGTQPQTEIDKVTTPGGITLKGLEAMEKAGFSEAVIAGLLASK